MQLSLQCMKLTAILSKKTSVLIISIFLAVNSLNYSHRCSITDNLLYVPSLSIPTEDTGGGLFVPCTEPDFVNIFLSVNINRIACVRKRLDCSQSEMIAGTRRTKGKIGSCATDKKKF